MIANKRDRKRSTLRNSIVSGETKTKYFKKGDTVVIHSDVPITFMGCTRDRIYKYEVIDHGLSHNIEEFKDNLEHPFEWVVTINALYDLKVTIEKSYISESMKLTVVFLPEKSECSRKLEDY